jgi:BirA family biotin operon repressor/biotin-[acetyl-CoA-carboxylase] ligase
MDMGELEKSLQNLPIGPVRYFESVGSTNDEAADWANQEAPNLSLVVAGEQTAGRGRQGRRWHTPPGVALAFSMVLRPKLFGSFPISYLTGLGGLAVCTALQDEYGLQAEIKWPNDVLVSGKKLAGVLVETSWQGGDPKFAVLGIGINVAIGSVPPESELNFPATSVEAVLGSPVDRQVLLRFVLEKVLSWLPHLKEIDFLQAWERQLAYRSQWVQLAIPGKEPIEGRLLGLDVDGSVILVLPSGVENAYPIGQIHLRMVDRP